MLPRHVKIPGFPKKTGIFNLAGLRESTGLGISVVYFIRARDWSWRMGVETDEAVTTGAKRAREWCHVRTICARVPARARACAPYRLFWDRLPSLTRDQGRSFRWLSWQIRLLYCIIAESRRQIFSRVSVCFQKRITIYVRSYLALL